MRNYNFKSDFSFLKKKWSYAILVSNSHGCYTESPSHVFQSSGLLGRTGAVSCCAVLWDGLNLPVFSAELWRPQAEHVLKTWLSFVGRALGTSSGKYFISQLAAEDYWMYEREVLSLGNIWGCFLTQQLGVCMPLDDSTKFCLLFFSFTCSSLPSYHSVSIWEAVSLISSGFLICDWLWTWKYQFKPFPFWDPYIPWMSAVRAVLILNGCFL